MNGIINVLKPTGMTSHDVVSKIRKIISIKKVGHAGTLDPNAAGVILICVGKATKFSDYLINFDKEYICEMKLGFVTDTYDNYGKIIGIDDDLKYIEKEDIIKILYSFLGDSDQLPPMYSAIKIKGKKLYEYARNNEEIERKKRKITIKNMELLGYDFPNIKFKVTVSKGTYIRTLCYDIGEKLDTFGTMMTLIRTKAKKLQIEDSYTLEDIDNMHKLNDLSYLLNFDDIIDLQSIIVKDKDLAMLRNGMKVQFDEFICNDEIFFIRNELNTIIGIGELVDNNKIKIKKLLI